MRKVTLSLVAAAIAATATPAMAEDNADNFSGFRLEALAGYETVNLPVTIANLDGATVAIAGGYDHNIGGVVLGVEAEAGYSISETPHPLPGFDVKGNRSLYAGVRAGVPVSEDVLLYAKGGYVNNRLRVVDPLGATFGDVKLDGWRAGAGAEYRISDKIHVKGEYRFSGYDGSIEGHQVMVGVGMRF
ncbi:MAG: outer membrane beta-barrel protein [Sphingorhabdus sp.]